MEGLKHESLANTIFRSIAEAKAHLKNNTNILFEKLNTKR
jgi:hypothetical protein